MFLKFFLAVVLGPIMLVLSASASFAEDITLKSLDGSFSLKGALVSFEDEKYTLDTVLGRVVVNFSDAVCEGEDCPDLSGYLKEFAITGSSAVGKTLMPLLLEAFSDQSNLRMTSETTGGVSTIELTDSAGEIAVTIALNNVGSSSGFVAVADGSSALGMSSRRATEAETTAIKEAGLGDIAISERQTILALGGLVILVSDQNPVRGLSIPEIGAIFAGTITNWAEVGGADADINVYRQNVASGDSEFFRNSVLALTGGRITPAATVVSSHGNISKTVNADPFGVGFSSFTTHGEASAVSIISSCGIISAPTEFSIKTEEYSLSQRLTIYSPDKDLPPMAMDLSAYLGSDAAQSAVAQAGYVSLHVDTETIDSQGLRFANAILAADDDIGLVGLHEMTTLLIDAERLSTTFRFNAGTSTLDARAQLDVNRLAALFSNTDYTSKEIMFIGFSDSVGKAGVNAELAKLRAKQVLDLLHAMAPDGVLDNLTFSTIGLGESSPLACNDTPHGRFVNRRVEVWLRDKS